MASNNGSYSNQNGKKYYPYQGYSTNPQGYQQNSSTSSYYPYPNATPMMQTASHDSSGSSNSTYSSNPSQYSYNVSPAAYSPTETHGYGSSQTGYPAPSVGNSSTGYFPSAYGSTSTQYLTPSYSHGHGNHYHSTATPQQSISSTNPSSTQSISPSPPSPTSRSYPCVYPGCPRSFPRPYDLDRHMKVHFPDAQDKYDCPEGRRPGNFCKRVGEKGFTRKDHRDEHVKKVHLIDKPKSARGTRS